MHYLYKYLIGDFIVFIILDVILWKVGGNALFVAELISAGFLVYTIVTYLTIRYNKIKLI